VCFTGLCHQVADKYLRSLAFTDGGGDSRYEQVGQNTGVKRTRPKGYHICRPDRFQRFRKRQTLFRLQTQPANWRARGRDLSFASHDAAVFKFGCQADVTNGGWIDVAFTCQNLRRQSDCFGKVTCNLGKGCQEKIAEAMTPEF